ncbi:MAG: hypothetical protein ACLTK0_09570 [Anaerovoracaceae bacterium]
MDENNWRKDGGKTEDGGQIDGRTDKSLKTADRRPYADSLILVFSCCHNRLYHRKRHFYHNR